MTIQPPNLLVQILQYEPVLPLASKLSTRMSQFFHCFSYNSIDQIPGKFEVI